MLIINKRFCGTEELPTDKWILGLTKTTHTYVKCTEGSWPTELHISVSLVLVSYGPSLVSWIWLCKDSIVFGS